MDFRIYALSDSIEMILVKKKFTKFSNFLIFELRRRRVVFSADGRVVCVLIENYYPFLKCENIN